MTSRRSDVSELPSLLIPFILVKLPIKMIIRCRCVCKNWNQLILDPYFSELYSNNSKFTVMLLLQYPKLYTNQISDGCFRFIEIGTNNDFIHTRFNLDQLITSEGEYLMKRLVGSVNGLLCLVVTPYSIVSLGTEFSQYVFDRESVFVINPLSGESVAIPRVKGDGDTCRESYGFGSTVDRGYYKVVRIVEAEDDGNDEVRLDLKIITVGVDEEWRDFVDPLIVDVFVSDGVSLNGVLHWLVHKSDFNSIYAFDVGKEIGSCIAGPSSNIRGGYLGVWDGHLCFVQEDENELQFCVWSMRQYGVAESWTKYIMVRNSVLSRNLYPVAIPRTTRRNRDLVLSVESYDGHKSLISFDPKTENYVKFDEVYDDEDTDSDLLEYAPCFSSLTGMISRQQNNRDS